MKIALVNPPYGYNENQKIEPIGLGYLMAMLEREGIPVDGYDFGQSVKSPGEIVEFGNLNTYDIIGFTVYNDNVFRAVEISKVIKQQNPNAQIVFGGPHATATYPTIMKRHAVIDFVIRKEGEYSFLALVQALQNGAPLDEIRGLSYRVDATDIRHNEDAEQIGDLDALPFPLYNFKTDDEYENLQFRGKPALMVSSSRSCPFDCSFCGVIFIGRKWRMRSAESVIEEIKHMEALNSIRYGHIYFSDANFFVRPDHALEIAEALHAHNPEITFSFSSRANQIVKARDYIPKLKKLGCEYVEIGIESNSEDVLKRMSKRTKPLDNVQAIEILRESDIELILDFIMFDPEATLLDLRKNLNFMREMGFYEYAPHDGMYQYLVLYAGAPIRDHYEKMFNVSWNPDEMPDHPSLFVNQDVRWVFDLVMEFKRQYQVTIGDLTKEIGAVLQRLERAVIPPEYRELVVKSKFARIRLIHIPYLFFEYCLKQAEAGNWQSKLQVADVLQALRVRMEDLFQTTKDLLQELRPINTHLPQIDSERSTYHPYTGGKKRALPDVKEA